MLETFSVLALIGACWLVVRTERSDRAAEALMSEDELYDRWADRQW